MEVIGQKNPGDKVDVVVHRDGKELTLPVTLVSEDRGQSIAGTDKLIIHGAVFQALTDEERAKLDVDYGFKIVKLDEGKLKNSGIRVGFIVLAIDRKPVTTADDLREALSGRNGGVLIEGVYPNGLRAYYGIGL